MTDIVSIIGIIIFIIGGIFFLIESFRESVIWGLACLFVAPVVLVFTFLHWDVAKKPFFIQLTGFVVMLIGAS
ncbi:hypothetical protein EXZ60_01845 [Vibrio sp. 1151_11]|uniref:hypothetical protein n=1 Tax=Vibrio sp. 1151_11 TaxID=2527670 RepID=UPI002406D560|nr:hypothetical protein [Vibrio sp. 1151_11]MDF9387607.1 hypothetical protein [Vibrio sp. 1151_11]